ncbi:MAG: hypothetical protein ACI4SK_00110 [Christensenellales bacterium]
MLSVRAKNIIIIVLITLISAAIIGGSVYVAVESNKNNEEREFFFDSAPINYSTEKNFYYANLFREAVAKYLQPISNQINLEKFADQLLEALSTARVPAYKLGTMASALKKYGIEDVFGRTDIENMTDEELEKLFKSSGLTTISNFLNGFFTESGLTGEETGLVLYNYFDKNFSDEYRLALHSVGKENFVRLASSTAYFITSLSDIKEGTGNYVNSSVVKSALYELGSTLIAVNAAGADNVEKVLGLRWNYGSDKEYATEINAYSAKMSGKIGLLLPLIGCVLRQAEVADIEYARQYAENGSIDALVLSHAGFAKAVDKGIEAFGSEYGDVLGEDVGSLKARLVSFSKDLYCARMVTAGINPELLENEEFGEIFDTSEQAFERFFSAVEGLKDLTETEDTLSAMSASEKEALATEARNLWALEKEGGEIASSIAFMWTSQIFYNATKGLE